MLDPHAMNAQDISALNPGQWAFFAEQLLAQISEQSRQLGEQSRHISAQDKRIYSDAQAIKWRHAKIESITFQLARLKAWKFGARTERINAEQRSIFEETLAADEASLEAQLAALQPSLPAQDGKTADKQPRRQPKREALPPHLPRVDTRIEPENTNCPSPECGQPMVRVGEDVSERLEIVPYAVAQLRLADPSAIWEVRRFDGLPYLASEAGVFVEVAVTVQGITMSQIHPVLDGRNRPLMAPTSFDINTSIQRCLVKAIALHGLGLYIYAGEDLPQAVSPDAPAANDESMPVTVPASGQPSRKAEPTITRSQQTHIHRLVVEVGAPLERVLAYFGVKALPEIKPADFSRVVRSLEKRRTAA